MITIILMNPVAWLALAVSIVSAGVTIWRFRRDSRRQNSHDYLTASTRLLEQAFEAFDQSRNSEWSGLPEPNRLLWLTVARMLTESGETAREIKEDSHRTLYSHARNLWRGKLHDLLIPLKEISLTYFAEDADSIVGTTGDQRMCISDKSLRVVLGFVEWPENKPDPLEGTESFTEQEIDYMRSFRYRAVADYLEAKDAMIGGDEGRKEFWREKWHQAKQDD